MHIPVCKHMCMFMRIYNIVIVFTYDMLYYMSHAQLCIYIYMYIYIYIYVFIYLYIYTSKCVGIYIHVHI